MKSERRGRRKGFYTRAERVEDESVLFARFGDAPPPWAPISKKKLSMHYDVSISMTSPHGAP